MEVVSNKKLHYHVVPLLIVSVVVLVMSLSIAFHLQNGRMSANQLLTERLFTISPTKNGLFEIRRSEAAPPQQTSIGDLSTTGESALFQSSIYSQ